MRISPKKPKYPKNKHVFVDVDGTLKVDGKLNKAIVKYIVESKKEGFKFTLWSARGQDYAFNFAKENAIDDIFDNIIDKPGYILDDKGWRWVKHTEIIPFKIETY